MVKMYVHRVIHAKSPKKVKYRKLSLKEVEATPWDVLCIDLIRPYKINNNDKKLTLWALTMIDPATGWFDISAI